MAQAIQIAHKNEVEDYQKFYPNTVMNQIDGNIQVLAKIEIKTNNAWGTVTVSNGESISLNYNGNGFIYLPYGTYTFSMTKNSDTVTKALIVDSIKKYVLEIYDVSKTLNDNDWATISAVSNAGLANNYWNVGDAKTIILNGQVGNITFSNLSIDAYILGINHNAEVEGNNRIHFCIGKVNNKTIGLVDSQYNNYPMTSSGYFSMSCGNSNTNSGGWEGCYMRSTIMSAIKDALPTDLKNVLKTVTKFTDNTGGGSDNSSYVTATTETICLEAEFEVHGARTYANSYEQNKQQQYDYYKNGNSKIRYKYNDTNSAVFWWNRSPYSVNSYYFCVVYTGGSANGDGSRYCYAVAPCFYI